MATKSAKWVIKMRNSNYIWCPLRKSLITVIYIAIAVMLV